jgi:hypothetical protein
LSSSFGCGFRESFAKPFGGRLDDFALIDSACLLDEGLPSLAEFRFGQDGVEQQFCGKLGLSLLRGVAGSYLPWTAGGYLP